MFYYVPLNEKYIVSMNGDTIKSISKLINWKTNAKLIEVPIGDDVHYHVNKQIKQGNNRGFFSINKLIEHAIAQGEDDLIDKLPQKPKHIWDKYTNRIIGNPIFTDTQNPAPPIGIEQITETDNDGDDDWDELYDEEELQDVFDD